VQQNTETDGGCGSSQPERAVPAFAPSGGAFRIIEVTTAASSNNHLTSSSPKNADVKVISIF
jgi:hypothetical protein